MPSNRKKQRTLEKYEPVQEKFYLFCEGERTEPLYFKGFEKEIKNNPIYKNLVFIKVEGLGKETLRVIYEAEQYVKDNKISHAQIWCIYDKDSFPAKDFNAVSEYADNLNKKQGNVHYYVAWSNQCIEYWFILHFDWYDSDNDRKYYRKYLHKKFADLGWKRYTKNNDELFYILTKHGNPKLAIQRATRRLQECEGKTDADSIPATKVHLLVSQLAKYLPEDIKHCYLREEK